MRAGKGREGKREGGEGREGEREEGRRNGFFLPLLVCIASNSDWRTYRRTNFVFHLKWQTIF